MNKKTIFLIIFCIVLNITYIYNRNSSTAIIFSENIELVDMKNFNVVASVTEVSTEASTQGSVETYESTTYENTTYENVTENEIYKNKINVNTASKIELQTLPSIGEVLATRIIDYRNEFGNFKTIEDIKNISGIGDKTFENLKDLIIVE